MADDRLRRINIPIPNPALGAWLKSPQCRAEVEKVTTEIFTIYVNTLPIGDVVRDRDKHPGRLRASAGIRMQFGGWGAEADRWFGYVTNSAPYAGVIEYGNTRISAQGQLRRAAGLIASDIGGAESAINIPGVTRDRRGRGSQLRGGGGRFIANPLTGRRRPQK